MTDNLPASMKNSASRTCRNDLQTMSII